MTPSMSCPVAHTDDQHRGGGDVALYVDGRGQGWSIAAAIALAMGNGERTMGNGQWAMCDGRRWDW